MKFVGEHTDHTVSDQNVAESAEAIASTPASAESMKEHLLAAEGLRSVEEWDTEKKHYVTCNVKYF